MWWLTCSHLSSGCWIVSDTWRSKLASNQCRSSFIPNPLKHRRPTGKRRGLLLWNASISFSFPQNTNIYLHLWRLFTRSSRGDFTWINDEIKVLTSIAAELRSLSRYSPRVRGVSRVRTHQFVCIHAIAPLSSKRRSKPNSASWRRTSVSLTGNMSATVRSCLRAAHLFSPN